LTHANGVKILSIGQLQAAPNFGGKDSEVAVLKLHYKNSDN